jgi:ribonuclease VapC
VTSISVDTSAIMELLTRGPRAPSVRQAIDGADRVFVTSVARVEAALVLIGRFGWTRAEFNRAWNTLGLSEEAVDSVLADSAIDAFETWGRGRAKAGLNFGDCFSFALAVARGVPLLFVGDDFSQTGVPRA